MYPNKKQKGFAIVSAIFLIVVLAFLGVSMSRILTTGQQAINQDISSLQAYYAGRSAIQWGMYQSILADAGTITLTNKDKYTLTFSNAGLNNTTSEIIFNINTVLGKNYYNISSIADYGTAGNPEFSRRNVEIRFVP